MKPDLHCGPAGWSYPHWNSVVYPQPKPRGFHPLEFLSQYFDTIEINSTFYRPVRPEIARLWKSLVSHNASFLFTAKLGRRFTHERDLNGSEIGAYKDGLWPLWKAGRLGCVLMQFPWSFRFTPENRDFFVRLRRTFHDFPLVAEMRHASWAREEAIGTLIDYHVGFCNIDQPSYEKAMPPTAFLTSPIGYVRLHGRVARPGSVEFEAAQPRNDYLYSQSELRDWVARTERIRSLAARTFFVTTNDAAGKAVVNALQLQLMLGLERREAPGSLIRKHRAALEDYRERTSGPFQETLFTDVERAPGRAVA